MDGRHANEIDKCIPLLNECRTHLGNAMYRMGEISEEDYMHMRSIYELICKALDKY